MAMANWAELPNDLIVKCVKTIEDFVAFGVVCTSWCSSVTKANFNFLSPQLPLLMLADKGDCGGRNMGAYSLEDGKVESVYPADLDDTQSPQVFDDLLHCGCTKVFVEVQSDTQSKSLVTKLKSSCSMTNPERYARKNCMTNEDDVPTGERPSD
ncbi:hypothetical protein BC332_23018 [Capsicum chinense]|nr:hypothetical protein BC332_23018 [Capsicum chinense]